MRRLAVIILVAAALGACAYQHEPIYNVDKPLPLSAQKLPLDRIEALIIRGGEVHRWIMVREGPGHLVATQRAPKFEAVVDIYFDQKRYSIMHKSSVGLLDTGTTIHSHYNVWIRNLEKGIDTQLSVAK